MQLILDGRILVELVRFSLAMDFRAMSYSVIDIYMWNTLLQIIGILVTYVIVLLQFAAQPGDITFSNHTSS